MQIYAFEKRFVDANPTKEWTDLHQERPWTLMYRKETFMPWLEVSDNIDMIYRQIIDGMERGIYICSNVEAMCTILAIRYYIDTQSTTLDSAALEEQLRFYPLAGMEIREHKFWSTEVSLAFSNHDFGGDPATFQQAKSEVLDIARNIFTLEFAEEFNSCSVEVADRTLSGVVILLNSYGLYVAQDSGTTTR